MQRTVMLIDCLLAFGIPTDHSEFQAARDSPRNRDFVPNVCCGNWRRYERQVVKHVRALVPLMRNIGAHVVNGLTLSQFGELLPQFDVTILFTHWTGTKVEFSDGLADVDAVIRQIPEDYNGILDLCVCRAVPVAVAIRNARPKCGLVRFSNRSQIPLYWLHFYLALFTLLASGEKSYLLSFEEAAMASQLEFQREEPERT